MECTYCIGSNEDRDWLMVSSFSTGYFIFIDENNNLYSNENGRKKKINYCPMCGRELI